MLTPHNFETDIETLVQNFRNLALNQETFNIEGLSKLSLDIVEVFNNGGKIAFMGNGGSAAEAMHLAAEFTGKCVVNHKPLPAICLNESQSSLTAIANDFGNEYVFSRQVDAHLKAGDLLIGLSTSGRSKNILNALDTASEKLIRSMIWMGDFEFESPKYESWKVPSKSTPRIQEIHLAWGHILAEIVEREFIE
jgi:D-sedoheptulose 7-phosphate isomerase